MEKKRPFSNADDLLKSLVINKDHITKFATGLFSPHEVVDRHYLAALFRKLENLGLINVTFADNNVVYHIRITPDGYEYEKQIEKTRWRKARNMFEPLLDPYRRDFLEILKQYSEGSFIPYSTEQDSTIEALKKRGYLCSFEKEVNGWGVSYSYEDKNYLALEENYNQIHEKTTMSVKFEGGYNQFNLANNDATIHATQNVGVDLSKLTELITALQEHSKGLSHEDKQTLEESLEVIQSEFTCPKPKKSLINFATKTLQAIGGSVEFLAAAATLVQFIQTVMSTLG